MTKFPSSFEIGPVKISPATVLAPMAGVTDTVFRRFIRRLGGCGLIMTEFTSSHGLAASLRSRKPTRTLQYLVFEPEEHPISAQLFGADPDVMAKIAECRALEGSFGEALHLFNWAIKSKDDFAPAFLQRALCRNRLGDTSGAAVNLPH